jgi:hypothetical protein
MKPIIIWDEVEIMDRYSLAVAPWEFYYPADEANRLLHAALDRAAALETALKFMSRQVCRYRARGLCLLDCPGAMLCDLTGLVMVRK